LQGDRTLQNVARIIDETVRDTDIVARYGGEEFVVVMPHTDLAGGSVFAERLRAKVEETLKLTLSGGVATALDGDNPHSLLTRADAALYKRQSGRPQSGFLPQRRRDRAGDRRNRGRGRSGLIWRARGSYPRRAAGPALAGHVANRHRARNTSSGTKRALQGDSPCRDNL